MTTIREWLIENKDKYSNRTEWIKNCVKEKGVNHRAVQRVASQIWPVMVGNKPLYVAGTTKLEIKKEIHLNESDVIPSANFLQDIDDVAKVIEFLNGSVKDDYIEEEKLRRRFGINQSRWKDIIGLPIFEDRRLAYQRPGGSKVSVLSSKKGIENAKQTISMARYDV